MFLDGRLMEDAVKLRKNLLGSHKLKTSVVPQLGGGSLHGHHCGQISSGQEEYPVVLADNRWSGSISAVVEHMGPPAGGSELSPADTG